MKNFANTRRIIVAGVIFLIMCTTMAAGTTIAWFSRSASEESSSSQSDVLDVAMYCRDLGETSYKSASDGPLFNHDRWEPGYITAKVVRIENKGILAFDYQLKLNPSAEAGQTKLADVIDVYVFDADAAVNRKAVAEATPVGTMSALMAEGACAVQGRLEPNGTDEYCIALKMQESAGNEYQSLTLDSVSVQVLASQLAEDNVLIVSEEFTYGSYFDHNRFEGNTGTRLTSGDYGKIRAADALLPAQDITIRVGDADLSDYKVTLGYFTQDGVYTGCSDILPMTNGELSIKASEMSGAYFRVNVYLYNGSFTKVPESAKIVVYGKQSEQTDEPISLQIP